MSRCSPSLDPLPTCERKWAFGLPPLPPTLIAWYLNNIYTYVLHTQNDKFDTSQPLCIIFCLIDYHIECYLLWRNILLTKIRHNIYKLALFCSSWPKIMRVIKWSLWLLPPPPQCMIMIEWSFTVPPLPPLWAKVSIWGTPPPPSTDRMILEQPLCKGGGGIE